MKDVLVFGFMLFLLAAVYPVGVLWSKRKVKVVRKNCLRHVDEDAEFCRNLIPFVGIRLWLKQGSDCPLAIDVPVT
jgi:hypothetical protein